MNKIAKIFETLQRIEENTIHGTSFMCAGYNGLASVMIAKTKDPSEGLEKDVTDQASMDALGKAMQKNLILAYDFDISNQEIVDKVLLLVTQVFDQATKLN